MASEQTQAMVAQQLDRLTRARYSIIAIQSAEEDRVVRILEEIAQKQNKKLVIWTLTNGLHEFGPQGQVVPIQDIPDPMAMLQSLAERDDGEGRAIYLVKDIHPFLGDPGVVRSLRDVARQFLVGRKNLILLSSY